MKHAQGPKVWACIRRLTTFTNEDFFLYYFEIETLKVRQGSNFIHVCLLLLLSQVTIHIHISAQWFGTPTGDLDPSLTFIRGWLGRLTMFLPYFPLNFLSTLNKILTKAPHHYEWPRGIHMRSIEMWKEVMSYSLVLTTLQFSIFLI